jgi:TorA maturation chaperone TorD
MSASNTSQAEAATADGTALDAAGLDDAALDAAALDDVLQGRAVSYRMFSRLFLKPLTDDDIEELAAMDFIARSLELEGTGLLAEGFNDMGRGLRKRNTGTRQALSTDYTMCFDGVATVGEEVAVPYASVFLGEKALFNQEPRNEVYKLFCAEGIGLKSNVKLPEDHLGFELEFLAVLSERAAAALEAGDTVEARRVLELSREFIQNHILTWIGLLAERAEKLFETRFYKGVMKAVRGYLELDLEILDELLEDLGDERAA